MSSLQDETGEIIVCAICSKEIGVENYISLSLIRQSINVEKREAEIHEWEDLLYFCGECKSMEDLPDILLSILASEADSAEDPSNEDSN